MHTHVPGSQIETPLCYFVKCIEDVSAVRGFCEKQPSSFLSIEEIAQRYCYSEKPHAPSRQARRRLDQRESPVGDLEPDSSLLEVGGAPRKSGVNPLCLGQNSSGGDR